jgi:uncharacterized glyoxalase superfamily protein PhnB/uncharacterized protein YndB with AHSA1/START domain
MKLVTYLTFDGTCEEAFRHYEKVLGGKITMLMRGAEAPPVAAMPAEFANRVMHAQLEVEGNLLMGADGCPDRTTTPQGFCAHVSIDEPAEAERIFRELGVDGAVTMAMGETFWARRFGMFTDRFGVPWMVNCNRPMDRPETQGKPFIVERTFDVARDQLWSALTMRERLQAWWGPKGASITEADLDFRPGGMFHYGMRFEGSMLWGRFVIREITAPERLVFVNSFSDPERGLARHPKAPEWPIELHTTITLTADGPRRTTLEVQWIPIYPTSAEQKAFDAGHESMKQGWSGSLDRLSAHLRNG